jgi:hypothetical protein
MYRTLKFEIYSPSEGRQRNEPLIPMIETRETRSGLTFGSFFNNETLYELKGFCRN